MTDDRDGHDEEGTHYATCSRCGEPCNPWRMYCDDCAAELEDGGEPLELDAGDLPYG